MEYTLFFPTPWDGVNPENDNIDVCLTFSDGRSYTFVVATPENLKFLMKQEGKPYLSPAAPILIAERLTEKIVTQLIAELVQDPELLRCYGNDTFAKSEEHL